MLSAQLKDVLQTTGFHLKVLKEAGISTVFDLLEYFPRTYEDRSQFRTLAEINLKEVNTIKGTILSLDKFKTKNGYKLLKGIFKDEKGMEAELVWFNQQHLLASMKPGSKAVISGRAKHDFGKISFTAPKVEVIEAGKKLVHFGTIVPIYSEIGKLSTDWFRKKMKGILFFVKDIKENLPEEVLKEFELMDRKEAFREIHFPTTTENLEKAQERLGFEELFVLQLKSLCSKYALQRKSEEKGIQIPLDSDLVKEFIDTLPFTLTDHQKIASFQILQDMEKKYPMHRLLEGDVGAGKTIVATLVALHTIRKGNAQVAIMAPTEVLASQHYKKIAPEMAKWGVHAQFLSGSLTKKQKEDVYMGISTGTIDMVIGTHALIQDDVTFKNLGLVIIDEQHRFGVEQRKTLASHGFPHVLHMTATPIPRTLALTIYGDQDLSVISQMPSGRKPITTKIIVPHHKQQMYRFIEDQMVKGFQAFVICPLIEESEKMEEVRAATKEYAFLQEHIFKDFKLALLHGKMKADEKEKIMNDFKEKKYHMLVSTSVVEVGIDIPNATVIVIEGAERFGLSQLHQFRGRVGRGEAQSYCFLSTDKSYASSIERLKAMEKHNDGFKLAEIDLELRGPGEVYGVKQSGLPDLKMANLTDVRVVALAREAAENILTKDPTLEHHPELLEQIV